ncbi:hypothetical protein DUI87_16328 [Hirundo rustica rustica]|uniref:Uncharacterized protein n=1 Tax=Hirundo rustica rustica TaxID=333673 RepID=A0A3M0K1L8_HIRRU|nr:hypothetical protein DUI87_16328 [Hirundo rustica rustica]
MQGTTAIAETRVRIHERNRSGNSKISETGGREGAPGTKDSLAGNGEDHSKAAVPLQTMEVHSGSEILLQLMEDPTLEQIHSQRHRFPDPLYYYPPQILHIDSVILLLMIPIGILQRPLGVC